MVESIDIKILDRIYKVACTKDEEERVKNLSSLLEKKAKLITEKYGIIPERNLLFMIGLMIADEAVKLHNKNINFENDIIKLKNQITLLENEKQQQSQNDDVKISEKIYILEKVLNRINQINLSILDDTKQLTFEINKQNNGDVNDKTI